MSPILSPDCRDGNHQKCNGDAWDDAKDQPWECECAGHYPDKENHEPLGANVPGVAERRPPSSQG